MNTHPFSRISPAPGVRLGALVALVMALAHGWSSAQEAPHFASPRPGGIPGLPEITGIVRGSNDVTFTWEGPSGNYQLFQKLTEMDSAWQPVGTAANRLKSATFTASARAALFKISGPSPQYGGSRACVECHNPLVQTVTHTSHQRAFTNSLFVAQGGQTDASCLVCHAVGAGVPTGFFNLGRTPHLANVQCENCHGPSAVHAAYPEDPVTRPRVDIAAAVCGGCHNSESVPARVAASHPPLYAEWAASAHASVRDELKADFTSASGAFFTPTCGGCHSGTVREALLQKRPLPSGHEAGAVGIACATCHDPHQLTVHTNALNGPRTNRLTGFVVTNNQFGATYTNQIRYPLASLADFHSTGNFATNFNPSINVCAQCHNDRGASPRTVDRPPHRSSQYNMLLGSFREADTGVPTAQAGTHALLEKQCVACHMPAAEGSSGHGFKVQSFSACGQCHESPELLVQFTTNAISYQIQVGKAALDFWAATKAPASLQQYGVRAWEYVNPGGLSGAGPSPAAAEQQLIPPAIQKARFNLYLVFNERSFGVHNGPYAVALLSAAYDLVQEELEK